ncbi:MAG: Crp/Fnr family transcriptional regulator [Anaerolineales bacterium]|nr:Crp/Fnr family transcriptional regulator [Anaerolineales bacterium]
MLTPEQYKRLLAALPLIDRSDPQFSRAIQQVAFFASVPAGRDVFIEGSYPDSIALVISGVVRVYKIGQTGREITLYRFGLGESCILTANAILNQKTFPAIATVEKDIEAVMIPSDYFRAWVNDYAVWREFVFDLLSDRLSTLMAIVDEILFQRMDERVAGWLVNRTINQSAVQVTHQEIAADLGSSREVISRILEDFRQAGLIESGRGVIEVLDKNGLESRAVM